jgi:hypothetical protein
MGTGVATSAPDGTAIPFRTLEAMTAVAGEIASILVREGNTHSDYTQRFEHGEPVAVFGSAETVGPELYIGFTVPLPGDTWTSLYFAFDGSRSSQQERNEILAEMKARADACASRPNSCCPDPSSTPSMAAPLKHQSMRVAWEYLDNSGIWSAATVDDDTRSLTLDGTIRFKLSTEMAKGGVDAGSAEIYYLRARLASGTYDAAPVATHIVLNGVLAEQTAAVPKTIQATGNGEFDQTIVLDPAPVIEESVTLSSAEDSTSYTWTRQWDFDASSRASRHFLIDAETGLITFGDGEKGLAPVGGAAFVVSFLSTRAEDGNLPQGRVFRLLDAIAGGDSIVGLSNATAATGGEPAESVIAAAGRAIEMLRTPQTAITISDYEVLTLQTPGTDFARVAVVPNCHPAFDCIEAPGIVTVIPMTHLPDRAPVPSSGTLSLAANYLNRRRMIGTRIEVAAPRYLKIAVRASFHALPGTSPAMLLLRVQAALDAFLNPVHGGPDQDGWPCGRDVYRSEILQQIDGVSGVDHVLSLALQAGDCEPVCGNVCVPALWFVTAGSHELQIL